jgi:hypothetical protein
MTNKVETYVTLKLIAERFSRVASEITDDEIKAMIKDTMREQLKSAVDFGRVQELIDDFMETHEDRIIKMINESLSRRFDE